MAAALLIVLGAAGDARAATTTTIAPATPTGANSFPFGQGDIWPSAGFIYKNIPAFELKAGDTIAFDLKAANEVDIKLQIAMARTTTNGGDLPGQAFQTLVNNTQTPLNPKGNTIAGDFELQYKAEAPFSFPGGGLIIRFSAPAASYAADTVGTSNLFNQADGTDTSGFFVKRFYSDGDGLPPYPNSGTNAIGAFRLIIEDVPAAPQPGKAKCKKKKKKRNLASAAKKKKKKKCKKKKKK